jgi:hypothetical protein
VQPYDDDDYYYYYYCCPFPSNWEPMEWSWQEKKHPSVNLTTTSPTCTDPGSNTGLRAGRPTTNRLGNGTIVNHKLHQREHCLRIFLCYFISLWLIIKRIRLCWIIYYRLSSYRAVNTLHLGYKNKSVMLFGKQSRFLPSSIQNT